MDLLLLSSFLILLFSLAMVLWSFFVFSKVEHKPDVGVLVKYYEMRRRYDRLKNTLVVIAALALLELSSIIKGDENPVRAFIIDIIFLAVVFILSGIYKNKESLGRMEK